MNHVDEREHWAKAHIVVDYWWCGDDVCDCHQVQVCLCTPNQKAGYPWICRSNIEAGEFFSQPDAEEVGYLEEDLALLKSKWGIEDNEHLREATPEEVEKYSNSFARAAILQKGGEDE